MGRESSVLRDEFELSLELSIGGCYSKSEKKNIVGEKGINDDGNLEVSRSDFSGGENVNDVVVENGCELADPLRRREIRALKRREARMKQSRGMYNGGGEERETDGNGVPEEPAAKRERIEAEKLNTSVVRVSGGQQTETHFSLPIGKGFAYPWVAPSWASNVVVAGERDGKSSGEEPENAAAAPSSSSLHRTTWTSHREGSSSDSGSHSRSFATNPNRTDHNIEPIEVNNCSTQDQITKGISSIIQTTKIVQGSTLRKRLHSNLTDDADKPSPPPPQMPRVSTTGNGPNGKTITGFLYKYMGSEVRIMCACHGSFFSPAEFVEHAGGVDVTHPLRHITVDPRTVKR